MILARSLVRLCCFLETTLQEVDVKVREFKYKP